MKEKNSTGFFFLFSNSIHTFSRFEFFAFLLIVPVEAFNFKGKEHYWYRSFPSSFVFHLIFNLILYFVSNDCCADWRIFNCVHYSVLLYINFIYFLLHPTIFCELYQHPLLLTWMATKNPCPVHVTVNESWLIGIYSLCLPCSSFMCEKKVL